MYKRQVLLFPVKSDIRSSHELQGALPILLQYECDELLAQLRWVLAQGCCEKRLLLVFREHRVVYR